MTQNIAIVGAGQAALQTLTSLRQEGFNGNITLIGNEPSTPYQRPPLSKTYLAGKLPQQRLFFKPNDFYKKIQAKLILNTNVIDIQRNLKQIHLSNNTHIPYDTLILTTGGKAAIPPIQGANNPNIASLRSLKDADNLRAALKPNMQIAIIGGGYIGLEIAASLTTLMPLTIRLFEAQNRLLARVASPTLAAFFLQKHAQAGIHITLNTQIKTIENNTLHFANGKTQNADIIILATGLQPNTNIARKAELTLHKNRIATNAEGQTSDPNIFAAGDCAAHFSNLYQRLIAPESVQNALSQAKAVAHAICRKPPSPETAPWFWSDQYNVKLQIAGLAENHDATILRGSPKENSFTLFYLEKNRLIAAESVNRPADFLASRRLIEAHANPPPDILANPDQPLKTLL